MKDNGKSALVPDGRCSDPSDEHPVAGNPGASDPSDEDLSPWTLVMRASEALGRKDRCT